MAKEIERKFLVTGDGWRTDAVGLTCLQGYVPSSTCTVRARIMGDKGYLTIKARDKGVTRTEFEYEIPLSDAELAGLQPPVLLDASFNLTGVTGRELYAVAHLPGAQFKRSYFCQQRIFFYDHILFSQVLSMLLKFPGYAACFWASGIFCGSLLFHQLKK